MSNRVINGIEIYDMANVALEVYREHAKQGSKSEREVIERKLTAIIINSKPMSVILEHKSVYRFGGFVMVVNEFTKKIEVLHWDYDNHGSRGLDKETADNLRKTYKMLGLSRSGNSFSKEDNVAV